MPPETVLQPRKQAGQIRFSRHGPSKLVNTKLIKEDITIFVRISNVL